MSQVLIGGGLFLAEAFGQDFQTNRLDPPFTVKFQVGSTIFNGNDVIAMVMIPVVFIALAAWLRLSNIGVAVRGSAERADRAATLGIPVRRLHTIVWTVATVLAFLGMWLRAGAVGLPIGTVLGPTFLLLALGAVVIGRMDRFGVIAAAAIALGILDKAITFQPENNPAFNDAVLFLVILGALLVTRRPSQGRVGADQVSTWQAAREVRPIPRELKGLPEVRMARWVLLAGVGAFLVTLPLWLDESRINLAAIIVIFGIIGVSLVVLTGWAGQVSLGQMGFAGVGAAVGGWVTYYTETDLALALLAGGAAGALAAIVVGYPALRRRGLTLAVSTLAFALFVSSFLLNQELFGENGEPPLFFPGHWLPGFRIDRLPVFGRFDIETETRFYFLCLIVLGLAIIVVRGVRRSRTGRVLIAIRENDSAARSFGIHTTRTTLACFALVGLHRRRGGGAARAPADRAPGRRRQPLSPAGEPARVLDGRHRWARVAPRSAAGRRLRLGHPVLPARTVVVPGDRRGASADPDGAAGRPRRRAVRHARLVAPPDRQAPQAGRPEPRRRRARRGAGPRAAPRGGRGSSRAGAGRGLTVATPTTPTATDTTAQPMPGNWFARWCDRTTGGAALFPLVVLFGLNAVDELDRTAFGVLLPEDP